MPKNCWIFPAVAMWLWVCGSAVGAASSPRYTVDKVWTTDEGLPQNSIIAMTQTRDGYLWLGTYQAGLVRFDGMGHIGPSGRIEFPVFEDSNTPGLSSKTIVKLFEDSHGNLWIGTETAGVLLLDRKGNVTGVDIGRGTRAQRLMAACEDVTGAVWLYTFDGQLGRYKDKRVDIWTVGDYFSQCRALIADDTGLIWVGSDPSLSFFDPKKVASGANLPSTEVPISGKVDFLLASKHGGHWRLINGRIQKYVADHAESDWTYPWTNSSVMSACEDREGNLVVGTYGGGVYWFDATGASVHLEGLSHNYILSLLVDPEGSLWVGTDGGGLNRVKRQAFDVLPSSPDWTVQSVCESGDGALWIGYNWEKIERWLAAPKPTDGGSGADLQQFTNIWPADLPVQGTLYARSVFVDQNQQVWAGFHVEGARRLSLFRLEDGRFQPFPKDRQGWGDVSAIYQDRKGNLWVATQSGLARWDSDNWRIFTKKDGLSSSTIQAITEDADGNLWVGTQGGGLNRLRDRQFTAFRKQEKDGLPSDDISSLYLDEQGVLWIGTSIGLARFHNGKWTRYSTREGLISNNIGYLLEDAEGYLWIGFKAGLMRISKQALNSFANGLTNSISCRAYGKADGLPVGECTFGSQPAACRTADGKLWFPTIKGLASVNLADLNRNTNPPPVVIESVLIEGELQNTNGLRAELPVSLTLSPGKERLEIDFTSLNLAAPERAQFRYRMERHDTAWIEAGNSRAAHYSKLPPGHYKFEVTACNEDGVWNERGTSLAITVLPPFWRTWWFLTVVTVCLLGLIVGSVHYVSTQKLQRQLAGLRQQEALEKERARIARDLHDELGANLTQVALLGELAEADKDNPQEIEAHAKQIAQTARDTTHALDEIVWTVNPSNDTLDGLIDYVCKYAQEYFALAGLRYRLDVPPQLPNTPISPELRHNMFLASKEAVNNVVKHAQASSAWLRLRLEPAQFTLEIEDNGRGLNAEDETKGRSGLRNMRKRMEDIGGEFVIAAGSEGGTLVRLKAPLGNSSKTPTP